MPRIYKSVNKEFLAREVSDILELPDRWKKGPAYEIVKAIFRTITEGLRRGEKVYIKDLGTFHVRSIKPHVKRLSRFYYNQRYNDHVEYRMVPEKKFVLFRPCGSLKKEVNATQSQPQLHSRRR